MESPLIPRTISESLILSVSVAAVDCDQLQVLQQGTRIRKELDMPASRTGQNRVSCARSEARTHQLIALQLLLAAQTAHGFTVGIGRDTAGRLDGWFHTFLEAGTARAGCSENSGSSVSRTTCAPGNLITLR